MVYNKITNVKCCQQANMHPWIYIVSSSELSNDLAIQFYYPLMTQCIINIDLPNLILEFNIFLFTFKFLF
jgi:hypothetical protein